jgi:integrase
VSQDALYRTWKAACREAGHTDLRLHDLRQFYGQQLAAAGQPEARIQVGLRHATAAMTRRYTKQRDGGETARTMAEVLGPPLKLVSGGTAG